MRYPWSTVLVLLLGVGNPVLSLAQPPATRGLVADIDPARRVLVLETRLGRRELAVARDAVVRDHLGRPLMLPDVAPGDAVAYRSGADGATVLTVAAQFWAIPPDE